MTTARTVDQAAKAAGKPKEPAPVVVLTKRVVLRGGPVVVLPDGVGATELKAMDEKALRKLLSDVTEGWVEVKRVEAASKATAIAMYAGKPGTATAIPGKYRAPGVSSWAGGVTYERPPEPLIQSRPLD